MRKHLVIPDVQLRPGDDTKFLTKIGQYIVEKKPDVVVCIGDFADMPSLSSYDVGKKAFEGRRYRADIEAVHAGMDALMAPLRAHNQKAKRGHRERYNPELHLTLGNHEDRITRAVNSDPKLDGTIGLQDLRYEQYGWRVADYLDPVLVDGVAYCHYFTSGVLGRPCTSAAAQLAKKHMSCVAGHQQGLQIHMAGRADGKRLTSIIAGSCLAPYHKVLTADLRYVPLSEVKSGDKLVSFDEHLGMSAKRSRRYKTGTVLNTRTSVGELFDVTLSSGKVFRTTKDHKWLTNNCMGVRRWTETQDLRKGLNGTKVSRLFDEWETGNTREIGWLAGMYDGEGSLYARKTTGGNCTQLTVSQSYTHNPEVCEALVKAHADLGFDVTTSGKTRTVNQYRISGGQSDLAKFLGIVRPERILRKFSPELLGTLCSQKPRELEHVMSVVNVGVGEYVEIEVDSATMVVEGYGHHNCYEHSEDYLGPQGNKHWRGILMLHEVNDGEFDHMPVSLNYLNKKYN